MVTSGGWLPVPELAARWSPLAAWLTEPERGRRPDPLGVVVLPPVGYEYSSSHRFWRSLAEALADRDVTTLRVDYPGTGDSAGPVEELQDLTPWRSTLHRAAAELAERGISRLVIVGGELGATFALLDGPGLNPVGIVTIDPVLSGRRYVRGLSTMGIHAPEDIGGVAHGGHYFSTGLLGEIRDLSASPPAGIAHLNIDDERTFEFMRRPAEEATVDPHLVDEVADWIAALDQGDPPPTAPAGDAEVGAPTVGGPLRQVTEMSHEGVTICERILAIGPDELIGVLTTPADTSDIPDDLYLLVNSGSDPHIGPGRAWVEMARELAIRGRATLRLDMRGWGESPDGPNVPGRPGDPHTLGDIARAVLALDGGGRRRIVLGGLCAGAWVTMTTARSDRRRRPGRAEPAARTGRRATRSSPSILARAHRRDEVIWIKEQAALGRWDDEDARGMRPPAGEWLDDLVRLGRSTSMVFAEGDDGLVYLQDRLARRLQEVTETGVIRVIELPEVDHAMHGTWLRARVFDTIASELDKVLGLRV